MTNHHRRVDSVSSFTTSKEDFDNESDFDLDLPFGRIEGIDKDDLRETAYEIFFTSCRSYPGFGGRNALSYYPSSTLQDGDIGGNGVSKTNGGQVVTCNSRVKRTLGLKIAKKMSPVRGSNPSSPRPGNISPMISPRPGNSSPIISPRPGNISPNVTGGGFGGGGGGFYFTAPPQMTRLKRPLTSAEIMRQQMKVSEQSDHRLRKTLMRTLVGQMGRRAETIILPLELLRHLKPSEFNDPHEYHLWQKRQLKMLEAGLLHHPSIPLDKSNHFAMKLREIIRGSELKTIDTGKNSETMKSLCHCVVSLAWRGSNGTPTDACHWADGFPLNVHIYLALLQSIFDLKDETLVLDDVDELLDLMKKTWSTLGINKLIHNVCFTWILFQQYVITGQTETDLLSASLAMLAEVANDAKRADREVTYFKILSAALSEILAWSEKKLLDYHECFHQGTYGLMENLLPLALSAVRILDEDVPHNEVIQEGGKTETISTGNRVDFFIRSSLRNAFTKMLEAEANSDQEEASEALLQLAKETEELAIKEKRSFSPMLKRWHPIAGGVAAMTLHSCYGTVLKQYLAGVSTLTTEVIRVLQRAGKLEKLLVQMVVEDSVDCEDGGKAVVREMVPYEVDSIIMSLLKTWIDERLTDMREYLDKAKQSETWNPKSKSEPFALSSVELVKRAKEVVDDFLEIPIGISDDIVQGFAESLEFLFQDYIAFVALCGSKTTYMPTLPPLTRCSRDSRFLKLWKKATPCRVGTPPGAEIAPRVESSSGVHPRPSTSRGTQRLYIRLNTLDYIQTQLHALDKVLALAPRQIRSPLHQSPSNRKQFSASPSYFGIAQSAIQAASQHVSEVAAYRLIFLDSGSVFYDGLYLGDIANARVRPGLRILKQNLTLLAAIIIDRVQPLAVKQVMKATFEAYLMVLLAGGNARMYLKSDHEMIEEDFENLKRVFCTCGEGLITEEQVEKESETVEGIVGLMGQSTDQLVEDFSIIACEASGMGVVGTGQKLPMPPTTGRWNRVDPNTILRVLCHRNDSIANRFLKTTFHLGKRK